MDGIHDLGGMEGFGPVPVKTGDADFRDIEAWEKRMWGLSRNNLAPGMNFDWFRHGIECMVPSDYLGSAYFDKRCANYLVMMLDIGTITMDDIKRGHVETPDPPAAAKTLDETLAITRKSEASFETTALTDPIFVPGQRVETRRHSPGGHTRLPRYARGARGMITAHHGAHFLPDKGARGIEMGEHLYTVAFAAPELWGQGADPRDEVMLDLWECYLVQA
jgi:nitrile hydratase subunit beta